jgi:hypothetical protein
MDVTQAWLLFDPEDLRTHPEEGMDVEMEFADGHVIEGMWGIDDLFEMAQTARTGSALKRWRYITVR